MQENVGKVDRIIRSVVGPSLMLMGFRRLGGRAGRPMGLASMIGGALIVESAITKVCPLNEAMGIDTRRRSERWAWRR
jgi:uncharacterized membrane protein